MYELIKISEKSYYINAPAKIGLYVRGENDVYLIDSGNDKDAGRKIRQILDKNAWHLRGILNTHSNADHIGGNKFLQTRTGCKIFSRGIESAFTKYPILEPSFLWGGYPLSELKHKFLLAEESKTTDFCDPDFPKEVKIIDLPGHFFDMVGFYLPDGTVFIADALSSKTTLDKYGISFIYDVAAYLNTLSEISNMDASVFVPSHADVTNDIKELVLYNSNKVYEVADKICDICKIPSAFEVILQKLFFEYGLVMTHEQYALVGSTLRSYLSWLIGIGRLSSEIKENMLIWKQK